MRYLLVVFLLLPGVVPGSEALNERGMLLYRIYENGQRYGEPGQVVQYRSIDAEQRRIEVEVDGEAFDIRHDYAVIPLDPGYAPSRAYLLLKEGHPGDPGKESHYEYRYLLARNVLEAFPGHPLADELTQLLCKATADYEAFRTDGKYWDAALTCYRRYLAEFPQGAYRDVMTWQLERPRTYEYEGYVGPMIEHVREHEAFLERHPDTAVRIEVQLAIGYLLLRAFDAWQDATDDRERGGYDRDDSFGFLQEARAVYRELLQGDDAETREQARVRLYEIDLREAAARPDKATAAVSGWSGFGEGFSSPANGGAIDISLRAHTAPSLTEWSNSGLVVDQLEVTPRLLDVRAGEPLYLDQIRVFALDPSGQVVERIPLSFSLEGPDTILDFEGYRTYGTDILTIGPGQATIWVESLLPTTSGETLREPITLVIR
jgi:hypothetical protein